MDTVFLDLVKAFDKDQPCHTWNQMHHSLNGSSDSVNSDFQLLLEQANFNPPHKIDTTKPIDKKSAHIAASNFKFGFQLGFGE